MATSSASGTSPLGTLDEVLAGRGGVKAVREITLHPLSHGLTELLQECFPGGRHEELRLLRTKYKPSGKLTAYYEIPLGHDSAVSRHLAVTWSAPRPPVDATAALQLLPDESVAPFSRLAATSADGRTGLLIFPLDPTMPQLGRLSDPAQVAAVATEMSGGRVPYRFHSVRTVRYRPGQRHVLHATTHHGDGGIFVKTDRDASGARAVAVARDLGAELARRCPGAGVAKPVGYSAADRTALWHQVAGAPLSQRVAAQDAGTARLVELVGRAVRALHEHQPPPAASSEAEGLDSIGSHDVRAELAATLRAGEHITTLLPPVGRTYRALATEIAERLDRLPSEPRTLVHGDLKCDNLMVNDGQLWILDLDRSCWADPALDLGKLVADLRWWCSSALHLANVLAGCLRLGYGPCDPARWARAALFAALFQLKFAARRCAVHQLGWAAHVQAQVAGAATMLNAGREV